MAPPRTVVRGGRCLYLGGTNYPPVRIVTSFISSPSERLASRSLRVPFTKAIILSSAGIARSCMRHLGVEPSGTSLSCASTKRFISPIGLSLILTLPSLPDFSGFLGHIVFFEGFLQGDSPFRIDTHEVVELRLHALEVYLDSFRLAVFRGFQ